MNVFKKNGGFTLVELIVVIAILAILAGVAVPAYSGYIEKANEAADMTMLDAVKTAIVFAATENDEGYDIVVKTATVTEGSTTVKITADNSTDTSVDISDYVDASDITFKSGASKAEWNGTKWELTP